MNLDVVSINSTFEATNLNHEQSPSGAAVAFVRTFSMFRLMGGYFSLFFKTIFNDCICLM